MGMHLEVNQDVAGGFERYLDQSNPKTGEEIAAAEKTPDTAQPDGDEVETPEEEEARLAAAAGEEEEPVVEEPGEETETAATVADDDTIETWSDLAEVLEIEPNELLEHIQIQGRGEGNISLSHIVEQWRNAPEANAESVARADAERTTQREEHKQVVDDLKRVTLGMIQRHDSQARPQEFWDKLRREDPAEYIRQTEQRTAEKHDIDTAFAQLQSEEERSSKEEDAAQQAYADEQADLVFKLRPDWQEPLQGKAAHEDISGYLQRNGFSQDQQEGLVDARSIVTVWKAAQYDKGQKAKPGLKKRLRKLPKKHIRASARNETTRNTARDKKRDSALDNFRKTGRIEDGAAFFEEHLD
jgi:hypothetical protein